MGRGQIGVKNKKTQDWMRVWFTGLGRLQWGGGAQISSKTVNKIY